MADAKTAPAPKDQALEDLPKNDPTAVDSDGVHSTHAERVARADHELTGDDIPEGDGIPSLEVMHDTTEGGGADRAEEVGIGAEMDYPEHEETYTLFLTMAKWGTITCIVLLIALAIGFVGSGGVFGFFVAFIVLMIAARILF